MKLWVGHILEKPNEWFLVWARSETDAICTIDSTYGEPDIRSLMLVDLPGCISLQVERSDDVEEPSVFLTLNADDELILERRSEPSIEGWVEHCVKYPLGPAKDVDLSYLAQQMRITQPEVLESYKFQKCPNCGSRDYSKTCGCLRCGYLGNK